MESIARHIELLDRISKGSDDGTPFVDVSGYERELNEALRQCAAYAAKDHEVIMDMQAEPEFSTQELIDRLEILAAQLPDEQCALVTTARNRLDTLERFAVASR